MTDAALMAEIPRPAGGVCLSVLEISDFAALESLLANARDPLVSDLTLGEWRPHQIAFEFSLQLGFQLELPGSDTPLPTAKGLSEEQIGRWVDSEAQGDVQIGIAYQNARQVLRRLPEQTPHDFLVLCPRDKASWTAASEWFIYFLACGLTNSACGLRLISSGSNLPEPAPPLQYQLAGAGRDPFATQEWPLAADNLTALVPGILSPSLVQQLGDSAPDLDALILLANGYAVLEPGSRPHLTSVSHDRWQQLHQRACGLPWIAAFAAARGGVGEARLMRRAAWHAYAQGSVDLALRYAEADLGQEGDWSDKALTLQTLRLAGQRYAELADGPPPRSESPASKASALNLSRAWGCTLSGRAEEACQLFQEELKRSGRFDPISWTDLYVRNIYALSLYRTGDWNGALTVELLIAEALSAAANDHHHLQYLNALNISRLYRAGDQFDEAESWFETAAAVNAGVTIGFESLHFAVLRARLYEKQGRTLEAREQWCRAALYFAAQPCPEALGWRATWAILGPGSSADPEHIALVLAEQLPPSTDHAPAPEVRAFSEVDSGQSIHGAPGWGVLISNEPWQRETFSGIQHRRLRQRLFHCLSHLPEEVQGLWIEAGRHIPRSLPQTLALALRTDAASVYWQGVKQPIPDTVYVEPGPGIAEILDHRVRFRRFRKPAILNDEERDLLMAACVGLAIDRESLSGLHHRLVTLGVLCLQPGAAEPSLPRQKRPNATCSGRQVAGSC